MTKKIKTTSQVSLNGKTPTNNTTCIINKNFKTTNTKFMLTKSIQLATLFLLLLATSCAYNNKFLAPSKYDANRKAITISRTKVDSTVAKYNGNNFQPTFLKNGTDTIAINYTLESVVFKSTNGNMLNGWMLKPKDIAVTHTILHLHGNGGSILSQFLAMKPLLQKGFQIFVFDYSGYGFSTGEATRKNLLVDGLATTDYMLTRTDVKNTKLVLYGQSYGGHLAAVVGAKKPNAFSAVVIEGAFSNHKDLGSNGAKPFIAFMSRIFIAEFYSGTKNIGKIKKPLLIIHSDEDKVIPYSMGQKLFNKAKGIKEMYTVKGAHLYAPNLYTNEIAEKIKKMTE